LRAPYLIATIAKLEKKLSCNKKGICNSDAPCNTKEEDDDDDDN
jgi:hypothetical protein